MRDKYPEFYKATDLEIDNLWNNGTFILDTNVLLDFYRLSSQTSSVLFKILEQIKLSNQLWLPYQIGFEFHKHRNETIEMENNEYDRLSKYFSDALPSEVDQIFKKMCNSHPLINSDRYLEQIRMTSTSISKSIQRLQKKHPNYRQSDPILDKITELYDNCVGSEPNEKVLDDIFREGSMRYGKKIPPGYMDNIKPEPDRYGDLIIWYQIIEKAISTKNPVIFVTRDTKKDWWFYFNNGEKGGARKELLREFMKKTEQRFYIYEITNFISLASSRLNIKITDKSTEEIKDLKSNSVDLSDTKVAEGYNNLTVANISQSSAGTVDSNTINSLETDGITLKGNANTK